MASALILVGLSQQVIERKLGARQQTGGLTDGRPLRESEVTQALNEVTEERQRSGGPWHGRRSAIGRMPTEYAGRNAESLPES
jgi:hypothetical protein